MRAAGEGSGGGCRRMRRRRSRRQPEWEVNEYKQGDTGDKSEDYAEDRMNLIWRSSMALFGEKAFLARSIMERNETEACEPRPQLTAAAGKQTGATRANTSPLFKRGRVKQRLSKGLYGGLWIKMHTDIPNRACKEGPTGDSKCVSSPYWWNNRFVSPATSVAQRKCALDIVCKELKGQRDL